MAKLIDLDLLTRYDSNLKRWIMETGRGVFFAPRSNFPQTGDANVLYVDNDKIYRWDESTQDYVIINSASGGGTPSLEWEEITTTRRR